MPCAEPSIDKAAFAALTVQRFYRGYCARRRMADQAILARERGWWNVLDAASLHHCTMLYYAANQNSGSAAARWERLRIKAAKVGRGLSQDKRARKLALQHWLEAVDARHRYGHNLKLYYDHWLVSTTAQPFFYWLDVGEGRSIELESCPRKKLQKELIRYLSPGERLQYEVDVEKGLLRYRVTGELVDTSPKGVKWIFVMDAGGRLYVAKKEKGHFQHSSFLAGGAAKAAGRITCYEGRVEVLEAHSGHYLPTVENFESMIQVLKEKGADLTIASLRCTSDEVVAAKAARKSASSLDNSASIHRAKDAGTADEEAPLGTVTAAVVATTGGVSKLSLEDAPPKQADAAEQVCGQSFVGQEGVETKENRLGDDLSVSSLRGSKREAVNALEGPVPSASGLEGTGEVDMEQVKASQESDAVDGADDQSSRIREAVSEEVVSSQPVQGCSGCDSESSDEDTVEKSTVVSRLTGGGQVNPLAQLTLAVVKQNSASVKGDAPGGSCSLEHQKAKHVPPDLAGYAEDSLLEDSPLKLLVKGVEGPEKESREPVSPKSVWQGGGNNARVAVLRTLTSEKAEALRRCVEGGRVC